MKSKTLLFWIAVFMPLVITIIYLPGTSIEIPAHYGADGMVNRWGSKYELLLLPIVTIFICTGLHVMGWAISRRVAQPSLNDKMFFIMNIAVAINFNVLTYWFLYAARKGTENIYQTDFDLYKIMAVLFSAMLIFLGNALPKCKPNAFIGIRTKWTLENEQVWYMTHRFGGRVFMAAGLIMLVLCLFVLKGAVAFYVVMTGLLLPTAIAIYYSYRLSKDTNQAFR